MGSSRPDKTTNGTAPNGHEAAPHDDVAFGPMHEALASSPLATGNSTQARRTLTFPVSETRPTRAPANEKSALETPKPSPAISPALERAARSISIFPNVGVGVGGHRSESPTEVAADPRRDVRAVGAVKDDDEARDALNATLAELRDSERALDAPLVPKDLLANLPPLSDGFLDESALQDDDIDSSHEERPSERSTVPTLIGKGGLVAADDDSSADPISPVEMSASELHTDRELPVHPLHPVHHPLPAHPQPLQPTGHRKRERLASTMPPPLPAQWKWKREVSLHTLLRGQRGVSKAEVLELEMGEDEQSDPIALSRVSRPAIRTQGEGDEDESTSPDSQGDLRGRDLASGKTDPPEHEEAQEGQSKLHKLFSGRAGRLARSGFALPLVASHVVLAATVALIVGSGRAPSGAPSPIEAEKREPRAASSERTPLVSPPGEAMPFPPAGACITFGSSRVLASRAQIGPGLEVSVLDTGFGVAIASGAMEALGLRVEGSSMRIAESVRVKAPMLVNHVAVDGHDDDAEGIDVRVDSDEARTVVGAGEAAPFRIAARGGYVMALLDDPRGPRIRTLWPVPGARIAAPAASPSAATPGTSPASLYRPQGVVAKGEAPPRIVAPASPVIRASSSGEVVRAVGRDDGGAVVAMKRPSMFWLGVTDGALAPAGPLVALVRKGAMVGTPAVTQWGGGGAVAWAERAAGEREWNIVVAGFTPDGEGATNLGPAHVVAKGMSPALATLPDGDLLLAFAEGEPGAHRVVALRLDREGLEARGAAVVVSPSSLNAGQPVAAVRADGRALVAFFAAEEPSKMKARGRSATVFATPLVCDPGL